MIKAIKNIVNQLYDVATQINSSEISDRMFSQNTRETTHRELLQFLMYLSASDGSIEAKEAAVINECLGEVLSPEEICETIEADNIYSTTFEQTVPRILVKLVRIDNSKESNLKESQAERYICLYEALGSEFIACDREVSQSERDDLNTYISNMRSYYKANYKGPKEAIEAAHFEHTVIVDTVRNTQEQAEEYDDEDTEESLDSLLDQLNSMIGLDNVKATVNQLIHFNSISQIREERGLKQLPITQHMVFYGNPGTGKTTVARLIAKIYHHLGILSKGHLVEVDRSGLVAGYVGHTALKVKDVVKQAKGGVLFIDEAYALTYKRSENDFGLEVVDTLIKIMEDERDDLVVIVAGYEEPMTEFINSNPGLKSRFNRFLYFEDYSSEQLLQIFQKMMKEAGYKATDEALAYANEYFEKKNADKDMAAIGFNATAHKKKPMMDESNFSNARMVRNFLESAVMNQADRLYDTRLLADEELCTIELIDVQSIE